MDSASTLGTAYARYRRFKNWANYQFEEHYWQGVEKAVKSVPDDAFTALGVVGGVGLWYASTYGGRTTRRFLRPVLAAAATYGSLVILAKLAVGFAAFQPLIWPATCIVFAGFLADSIHTTARDAGRGMTRTTGVARSTGGLAKRLLWRPHKSPPSPVR